jgi:TonB family protein
MSPETVYFLKVNIAFALFYAFYRLFFYKDTFFKLRRSVLLICFGLAILYPLLNIQEWMKGQESISGVILMYSTMLPGVEITADPVVAMDWRRIFRMIAGVFYWMVVAMLFFRFIMQLGSIFWLALKSKRMVIDGEKVYVPDKPSGPFSFFRMIFLYPGIHSRKEIAEILTHERTHASQLHSIDVLISECICIVCWINPFVWLLKREVRHNLEYLADNMVLQSGFDCKSYQYHLLGLTYFNQAAANLYNNFNVLHLKNRISMMNKKRSRAIGRTKYLIFLPLIGLLMLLSNAEAIARMTRKLTAEPVAGEIEAVEAPSIPQDVQKTVYTVVDVMPRFPGGENELLKFLSTNVKYPKEAQESGVKGRVIASFVVNEDGSISDARIVKGIESSLDAEALRVIGLMPKWTPGEIKGQPVATKYTVPVTFRLSAATGASSPQEKREVEIIDNSDPKNPVYKVVEVMPRFPGGENELLKFLSTNVKYPEKAQAAGIQGRVICSFVVEKDGSLSNIKVLRGIEPLLDAEAIRVIKSMPVWTPGKVKDKPVRVLYTVPVTFRLQRT